MEFLLAVQFLTRIPVTIRGQVEGKNIARAMAYFPLVGLLLGLLAAALHALVSTVVAAPVADLLAIAFLVVITGNLHGDALMDTVDGIFSGRPRERILEIMRDSRVGSHGVMAGVLVMLFKFVLLGQLAREAVGLPLSVKGLALIIVPAMGRWAQVYGATVYPYARAGSGGGVGSFTNHVGKREIFWASATVLAAAVILLGLYELSLAGAVYKTATPGAVLLKGGILAGAVFAGTAGLGRYIAGKIGGMTGDTFGAMNEIIEVLTLMMLHIMF